MKYYNQFLGKIKSKPVHHRVMMLLAVLLLIVMTACQQLPESQLAVSTPPASSASEVIVDFKGTEMALIPSGEVTLIEKDYVYRTEKEVTSEVPGFYLDIHEVTNDQYAECVDSGECSPPELNPLFSDPAYADHPVINVTQEMAAEFCQWRDARLPTTLEWEKAAQDELRNVDYFWGDRSPVCQLGSRLPLIPEEYRELSSITSPVMSQSQNMYGLYDMTGSMWEWVNDNPSSTTGNSNTNLQTIGYLRMFTNGGYGPQYESFYCSFRCAKGQ